MDVTVVLPEVFPLEEDVPPVALEDPPADVEAPVLKFPTEPPCDVEAPVVVLPTEPPCDVEAPVVVLPTEPPCDVEAPVVVLPTLDTEFAIGVLVTAPPVVPPVVSTVT